MNWQRVLLLMLIAGCAIAQAGQENAVTLDGLRIGKRQDVTRFVFDVSGPPEYTVAMVPSPPSVILKIKNASSNVDFYKAPLTGTPARVIQPIVTEDHVLVITLELTGPREYKVFTLPPNGQRGDRLVLDLYTSVAAPESASIGAALEGPATTDAKISSVNFSGTWEQEWAVETDGGDSQKFEALIEPRIDVDFADNVSLTAIARIRLDTIGDLGPDVDKPDNYSSINGPWYNDSHAELSLRELYLDTRRSDIHWRIGKQQVVWGQADGIKVLDVVNPQSYREFILDDFDRSRIPLTMVNMQAPVGESSTLQLLWIPDTTYHELAESGTPYYLTSPLLVPVAPEGLAVDIRNPDVPDNLIEDSDWGGRLSSFVGGWDVTFNYLYHYQDYPVLYQSLELTTAGPLGIVSPEYERNHLLGGTLSNAFGDFIIRSEVAYSTDTFHVSNDIAERGIVNSAELGSVLGLDWLLSEYDTLLSAQWFQSHLFDYHSSIRRGENEQNMSLYYQRDFANETWQFNALALYSVDNKDSLVELKLEYLWQSNVELWLGADIFSGDNDGIYGEFSNFDRILLGLRVGF